MAAKQFVERTGRKFAYDPMRSTDKLAVFAASPIALLIRTQ